MQIIKLAMDHDEFHAVGSGEVYVWVYRADPVEFPCIAVFATDGEYGTLSSISLADAYQMVKQLDNNVGYPSAD